MKIEEGKDDDHSRLEIGSRRTDPPSRSIDPKKASKATIYVVTSYV